MRVNRCAGKAPLNVVILKHVELVVRTESARRCDETAALVSSSSSRVRARAASRHAGDASRGVLARERCAAGRMRARHPPPWRHRPHRCGSRDRCRRWSWYLDDGCWCWSSGGLLHGRWGWRRRLFDSRWSRFFHSRRWRRSGSLDLGSRSRSCCRGRVFRCRCRCRRSDHFEDDRRPFRSRLDLCNDL